VTVKEKLNKLEELLDIEQDTLREDAELDQLNQWDSIAVISLIAMYDCDFEKTVAPDRVKEFKTVKDIMDEME